MTLSSPAYRTGITSSVNNRNERIPSSASCPRKVMRPGDDRYRPRSNIPLSSLFLLPGGSNHETTAFSAAEGDSNALAKSAQCAMANSCINPGSYPLDGTDVAL